MSEPKLISPLLDNFIMGDPISDHSGIRCCPAMENDTGDKYIVKIISVPSSPTRLDALMLTGALKTQEEAEDYFRERSAEVVKEIENLQALARQEGYLSYSDYQVIPMEDSIGFDIYILTPYRRTLERQYAKKAFSQLEALNLGLDICSALTASRRSGYLFINLKPSNICITENQEYKISDLGFLNLSSLKYASIPEHYIGNYTAPEIVDAYSSPNETMDVYALGRILYEIYNGGILPDRNEVSIPAPAYADEELSQIILKACDPNPENRWQDPAQMGQMLVSYMQKNGVFDIPIVPVTEEPKNPEDEIPNAEDDTQSDVEETIETEAIIAEIDNLIPEDSEITESPNDEVTESTEGAEISSTEIEESQIDASKPDAIVPDTMEEENVVDEDSSDCVCEEGHTDIPEEIGTPSNKIPYEDVSVEVSEILYQADILAAIEVPEPIVAPEPTEIVLPEPEPAEESIAAEVSDAPSEDTDAPDESADAQDKTTTTDIDPEDEMAAMTPAKSRWLKVTLITVFLSLFIIGGFLFFKFYVIKNIDNMEIIGNKNQLTVKITSAADDSLLSVSCKDTYGKIVTLPVVNDSVSFSDLLPNADYTITVNISGFHILTGKTTGNYFTPLKTAITEYHVDIGETAGSAILTFNVSGPDSKQWKFTYGSATQKEKTAVFTGHELVLTGLKEKEIYTGYLEPADDLFIDQAQPIYFTANELVQASNVQIVSCSNGKLLAKWTAPESVSVSSWTVRCFNDATFESTITTKSTYAEFSVPDCSDSYTVEVKAEGQKAAQTDKINKNTVTVSAITTDCSIDGDITLEWESETTPAQGWVIAYGVNGSDKTNTVTSNEKKVKISPVVPGAKYTFSVYSADSVETLAEEVSCNTPSARDLLLTIGTKQYNANNFQFSLCTRPQTGNWNHNDATVTYTQSFSPNQTAGFVVFLSEKKAKSDENVTISFLIVNEEKHLVAAESVILNWETMWENGYCYLNIPTMPTASGYYTITVLLNSQKAMVQSFTIQ